MKNKAEFFWQKTKSSLKHLGVVAIIISLSVMFSSLCIMSLISLSDALAIGMEGEPREQLGGDVKVILDPEFSDEMDAKLKQLSEKNVVTKYASLDAASQTYVLYKSDTFSQEYINLVGYNDESYPLDNVMSFVSGKKDIKILSTEKEGVVLSEILAKSNNIKIGDTITLVSIDLYKQQNFKVVDLISADYAGSMYSVFINSEKLKTLENITSRMYYIDGNQEEIKASISEIADPDINVSTFDEFVKHNTESNRSFLLFIRGVSILGLFIGSFGIASAIKVIVNKRKREIGILKAIGYLESDIIKMLLAEVAVISVVGSFVGVLLGYAFFYYLVSILTSGGNINLMIGTNFNLVAGALAFGVSIVSSILFAYLSIKDMSGTKPVYALKDMDYVKTNKEKRMSVYRFLLIGVIFSGISVFLAQSVLYGIGAVLLVSVAILLFSLLFRFIFFLILKIPVKTHNEIELSWINLRFSYRKIIFSMVAIFAGMVAVNLIGTLVYSTKQVYQNKYTEVDADINLVTDRLNPKDNIILDSINSLDVIEDSVVMYKTKVKPDNDFTPREIIGVDISKVSYYYKVTEGSTDGVVLPKELKEQSIYNLGDNLKVEYMGTIVTLPITGFYETDYNSNISMLVYPSSANFVSADFFKENFKENYIEEVWISTKKENEDIVLEKISNTPNLIITSSKRMEDLINSSINILINFSTSVASLALLAGIILIITITVLDVVSRRRDFAIYKVVGFKQKEVFSIVLLEYGIMTFLTASFATLVVYLFTIFMNKYGYDLFQISEKITFDLKGSLMWNVGLIALILVLVFSVSKRTLQVKPSEVLRYE